MAMSNYKDVLLSNLRETSDSLDFSQCYRLCAKKENLEDLNRHMHQVVWGRRGTGKTTLLKSFTYHTNVLQFNNEHAIYIMMSDLAPTREEISKIENAKVDLPIYIFKKLLLKISDHLLDYYDVNASKLNWKERGKFENIYLILNDAITIGRENVVIINKEEQDEETKISEQGSAGGLAFAKNLFDIISIKLAFLKKQKKNRTSKISKQINFYIETTDVREKLSNLLSLLHISHLYLCLDEFSDIDKVTDGSYSIQSPIAQLIKQVFLKSTLFSVKIATIWNYSKLSERNVQHFYGIEYKEDIFEGPDLDIMFLDSNEDALRFFKEIILNTYLLNVDEKEYLKIKDSNLTNDIIEGVFGENEFRHLVCGSQGIARSFTVLVRDYIKKSKALNKKLGFDVVFRLIIDQYLDNVRNRIAYNLDVPKSINSFIDKNNSRYFLVPKADYDRCEVIIKFLASKNFFMQFPGHRTPRVLRDKYKLFLINYGNYLDSRNSNLKTLAEDSKLLNNGILFPSIEDKILKEPEKFSVLLPEKSESQYYCTDCGNIVYLNGNSYCPVCKNSITPYSIML